MPLALSPLALSPADQQAVIVHAQKLLLFLLGGTVVLRGHVTAWMVELANLLTEHERTAHQPAPGRPALPKAARRKTRRAS